MPGIKNKIEIATSQEQKIFLYHLDSTDNPLPAHIQHIPFEWKVNG